MNLIFLETPLFTRLLGDYLKSPELGDVMAGTGGFRKARWHDARRGKGKRGD